MSATASELIELHREVVRVDAKQRRRMPELDTKRVDLLPAGSTVLAVAIELFEIESLTISDWALREGILLDELEQHPDEFADEPTRLRHSSVTGLARRCNSDSAHTEQVRRLALRLYDELADLHSLSDTDRELLDHAAELHDIGQHISRRRHHKHAAYLVTHGELRGFDPDEVALLAALMRHHRHGNPKENEPYLAALTPKGRDRVLKLAALLRVADGLDRGRRARVDRLDAQVAGDLVILRVTTHGDPELELWGGRRRRSLFEKVFDRELEIVPAGRDADL